MCVCVYVYVSEWLYSQPILWMFPPCGGVYQLVYVFLPSLLKNKLLSMLLLANLSDHCISECTGEGDIRANSMPIRLLLLCCVLLFLSRQTFTPQPAKCVHPSRADQTKTEHGTLL